MRIVQIARNMKQLESLKENWCQLLLLHPTMSVFQSFEYNFIAWQNLLSSDRRNSLYVYTIIDNVKNIAEFIIPLYIDFKGTLRFINDTHSDFCDAISNDIDNFDYYRRLSADIMVDKDVKRLSLINVDPTSPLLSYCRYFFKLSAIVYANTAHPFLKIDMSQVGVPSLLKHLNSSQKSELKRIMKMNNSLSFEWRTKDVSAFPEKDVVGLRDLMIERKSRVKGFLPDEMIHMIEVLFDNGLVDMAMLVNPNSIVEAISLIVKNSGDARYMIWIDLYSDKKNVNLANYLHAMDSLAKKGSFQLSLGRGTYPYKMRNFYPAIQNLYAFDFVKNPFFQIKLYYPLFKQFVKSVVRPKP